MTCDIFESPCLPCKIFINEIRNETGTFIATATEILNDEHCSYCAYALSWNQPELSIRGADQKDRSSGDGNVRGKVRILWPFNKTTKRYVLRHP